MVAVETFIAERPLSAKGNRVAGPPVAEPVYVYPRPYNWGRGITILMAGNKSPPEKVVKGRLGRPKIPHCTQPGL
jgi:hypothetical protein